MILHLIKFRVRKWRILTRLQNVNLCHLALGFFLIYSTSLWGDAFSRGASYSVCFTPQQDCTTQIVNAINNADNTILVQAYSFTSRPIGKALLQAKKRGVNVEIILDKSILDQPHNAADFFAHNNIQIWIDDQLGIAHSKVMVIDNSRVITGSFNFTRAAQQQNAENLLIIDDAHLARYYLRNWQQRQQASHLFSANTTNTANTRQPFDWVQWLWGKVRR